ncbi:MBL fold metallo-hydrolase [Corynebacterium aquatimens]|uniref:MBL fold metallo-hydrolase n=1 Tax=Corynebacterium TaxID=1716 RepID=UPI001F347690|nr:MULTISPECIES: MBL fold metallo-hydrolase [Corynebacterium]QYH19656.1 MBL fold metallo-hydrolase [Corynebacterium aquatimens]QYH19664.1 MBL fold metallo-hydrolase [Corynebacterium aquatimens]UIZ91343.1 MBL fold metallo-hydrolase [Corynebacterium sp. CNCTC7651]
MQIAGFSTGPYQTNCYVVVNEEIGHAFVVDPGLGAAPRVQQILAEQGVQLSAVLLTHGHLDHVRDAAELAVPVYIHPADAFMLQGGVPEHSRTLFDAHSMRLPADIRDLEDGATIEVAGVELTVSHAPGHSPGSVLLSMDEIVFGGDVLFRGSIGRTDLEYSDPAAMRETLRGPVWELDDTATVLPGHGPVTSVKQERASNPFLREANARRL